MCCTSYGVLTEYFYFISQQQPHEIEVRVSISNMQTQKTQSTSTRLNTRCVLSFFICMSLNSWERGAFKIVRPLIILHMHNLSWYDPLLLYKFSKVSENCICSIIWILYWQFIYTIYIVDFWYLQPTTTDPFFIVYWTEHKQKEPNLYLMIAYISNKNNRL